MDDKPLPLATRTTFLRKTPRRYRYVSLPELELSVRIQSLTEKEKSEFEAWVLDKKGGLVRERLLSGRRRLIVLCLVDEEGNRLLADDDTATLAELDGAPLSRLFDECRLHVGLERDDLENLIKNSDSVHVAATPAA